MVKISVGIVCTPERKEVADKLVASFNGYKFVYPYYDLEHKGSWYGHLGAMNSYHPECTHHLVIEDDVAICRDFMVNLYKAVTAVPDQVISVYASRAQKTKVTWANRHNTHWFLDAHGASGQGVLFPIGMLKEFIEWAELYCPPEMPYEDTRLYGWMYEHKYNTWNTVPSLIEHTMPMQSTLGFNNKGKVAAEFLGNADGSLIDWNAGVEQQRKKPHIFRFIGGIKGYTKWTGRYKGD